MKIFTAGITEKYSVKQVSEMLGKPYPLIHRSVQELLKLDFLIKDKHKLLSLNFRENHQELAYVEHLRSKELFNKNKSVRLLRDDLVKKFPYSSFVVVVFGSTVISPKPRDFDLLIIIEKTDDMEQAERYLHNIVDNYTLPVHALVISFESVQEMLLTREERNVMNEVLNKHLVLYGAELFYKLISEGIK